ncbi:MAG: membrane protein insertase YidC [Mariprofundaceae bacterium]|nr:membrane protein insertase YidC [Mariprofundaceae bacterium]
MDNRNLVIAFVLSMLVLWGWTAAFPPPEQKVENPIVETLETSSKVKQDERSSMPSSENDTSVAPSEISQASISSATPSQAKATDQIIASLSNDQVELDINEKGWLVHASLNDYKKSLELDAPNTDVLEKNETHSLYITSGIIKEETPPFKVIEKTNHSVTLQATLPDGRLWTRDLSMASNGYVVDVVDRIGEGSGLQLYRQIMERYPDKDASTFQEFVGPVGFIAKSLTEVNYTDIDDHDQRLLAVGGWTGITSRYFIAAIIGQADNEYRYYFKGDGRSYQAGMIADAEADGKDGVFKASYYMGPKSIPIMEKLGVELERSVDFGWFAAIAKPMHGGLLWLYDNVVGNYGWCIILLVIGIKILFFYPTQKSYESMAGMRKLQPEMERLKKRYGDDRQKMGQEVMALYKKNKVNPLSGCLPILIQIPVFFSLYKTLLMSIEMRHAPFIGWIHDMSVQDPYFILPVVMGASMFIQQKLNPQPTDPIQAKVMQFLPPLFTVLFLFFPAGLVLYWVVNNVLSIIQQWYVLKVKQAL